MNILNLPDEGEVLFIDTETTGFKKNGSYIQEGQGRVCQVAMLLTDMQGKSIAEFSSLVKPDNWKIGEGAQKIHGFTDEQCEKFGIRNSTMIGFYLHFLQRANVVVAHNSDFDEGMMEIECAYANMSKAMNQMEKKWLCTMKENVDIVKIPPTPKMIAAGFTKYKSPSLEETLQFHCGRSVGDGAHDAMYDVKACRDIFFKMRGIEV